MGNGRKKHLNETKLVKPHCISTCGCR